MKPLDECEKFILLFGGGLATIHAAIFALMGNPFAVLTFIPIVMLFFATRTMPPMFGDEEDCLRNKAELINPNELPIYHKGTPGYAVISAYHAQFAR